MPIEIAVGVGLAKNALDIVKAVREALKQRKLTPEEMKDYLETLQDKLVDVKTSLADADDERRALHKRIEELERCADFGKQFTFEEGVYWHREYPYCPNCWDADKKPIRLNGPTGVNNCDWQCPIHKSDYYLKKYYEPFSGF